MSIFSKIAVAAAVSAIALEATSPQPARAVIPVTCDNCSDIFNQILQTAKQAQQYATQLQQYQNELSMYANMVRNTTALPQSIWAQVQSDIMQVKSLSNAANLLSGNSGTLITRLNSATSYQLPSLAQYGTQLTTWRTTIGNSLDSLGKAMGLQQNQASSDAALAMTIQAHSQSAIGQLQAIQAGNEMAAANNKALMQIQQTLVETAQMQGTVIAATEDRRAVSDAAVQYFATPVPVGTGGRTFQ